MPAQKRPAPHSSEHSPASAADESSPPPTAQPPPPTDQEQEMDGDQPPLVDQALEPPPQEEEDGPPPVSDGGEGDNSPSSPSAADKDEFILVKLADIRKEVQCPICLGIIRKTRTVMECLHRFCRECIDKSMRLGNNECPACRTHCASRRSLRDDPNYDSLISALYPDIDKYEEEELAFHEEEKTRNRKIQASIAETFRRQSEALGKRRSTAKATAAAFVRKSQGNFPRGRGRSGGRDNALAVSDDDDDEDANGNDGGKDSSSAEDRSPEVRQKRYRRWFGSRSSPARTGANTDVVSEDNDDLEGPRENTVASPLRVGNREVLAWGKGGARSQTRHGNTSGSNGRYRGGRIGKLVEHLRNLDEKDDEYDVHLTLLSLDEQSTPNLERPYLCCPPTLSIGQLCQFIALQKSVQAEDVEMFATKPQGGTLLPTTSNPVEKAEDNPSEELQKLGLQESVAALYASYCNQGDLVLLYRVKSQS